MISPLLMFFAFLFYFGAVTVQAARVLLNAPADKPFEPGKLGAGARALLMLGILTHFAAIGAWCVTVHRSPFAGEYGTLSVASWGIAVIAAVSDLRNRRPAIQAATLLFACLLLFFGVAHARGPVAHAPLIETRLISLHVLVVILSFALFVPASCCAAFYLIQNRLLKERVSALLLKRLPALETLDSIAYRCVAFGLPLLTVGIGIGLVGAFSLGSGHPASAWLEDSHTVLSLVAWLLYVFYFAARLGGGWRGVRLQYILLMGMPVVPALFVIPSATHHFM